MERRRIAAAEVHMPRIRYGGALVTGFGKKNKMVASVREFDRIRQAKRRKRG